MDVTAYGATPGDGTDDSAAFARAVAAAGTGGTVVVPAGAFDLTGPVDLTTGQTLAGAGRDQTSLRRIGTALGEVVRVSHASGVTVAGLTLDGQNNKAVTQGVGAEYSDQLTVRGVRVQNLAAGASFGPAGIYGSVQVTHAAVRDSEFVNIGTDGAWGAGVRLEGGSTDATVENNVVKGTGRGGIFIKGSAGAVVRNNVVSGSGSFEGKDSQPLGIEVADHSDRAVVEGNRVDHWISLDNSDRVAVRRNAVADAARPGKVAFAGVELAGPSKDSVFTDNTVKGGSQVGFSTSNVGDRERILIARNAIDHAQTFGVQIDTRSGGASRKFVLLGNSVTNTEREHPFVDPADAGHGIRINAVEGSEVEDVLFRGDAISGNAGEAFNLGGVERMGGLRFEEEASKVHDNRDNSIPDGASYNSADPTAALSISAAGGKIGVGEAVRYSATFAGAGGAFVPGAVLWDFGDGSPEVGAEGKTHVYGAPGVYHIRVIGWSADGRAAVAAGELTVVPEPTAGALLLLPLVLLKRRRALAKS